MKIFTVQEKNFLEKIDSEGFIIPPKTVIRDEGDLMINNHNKKAYIWMDEQYKKRIKLPLDRNSIWVFNNPKILFNKNDSKLYNQYTFEVPMYNFINNFLWSDYFFWHYHLNYGDNWETEFGIFDINPRKDEKNKIAQGITTRLSIDWLKSITESTTEYKYY